VPRGVRFARATEEGQVDVRLEPYLMQRSLTFNEAAATLVRAVAGAPTVDEGIACYSATAAETRAGFADDALEAVKNALLHGVLGVSHPRDA